MLTAKQAQEVARTSAKRILATRCHVHPRYTAEHKPKTNCDSCLLLYVLRWQFDKKTDEKVGAFNPFAYLLSGVDLEDACSGIEAKPTLVAQA